MDMEKTKKLAVVGMLCGLAYAAAAIVRIPLILFLKYEPKDIIITLGGLIFGPFVSLAITIVTCVVQMVTISGTGILGCIMNIISSVSFACTAALIYHKKHNLRGAVLGLLCGWGCQVMGMMLWNYFIAPIYMGYSREVIADMLVTTFLPFNLIKGGINTAVTLCLYKPVVTAMRRSGLIGGK